MKVVLLYQSQGIGTQATNVSMVTEYFSALANNCSEVLPDVIPGHSKVLRK
jgi:hypothetical protein